MATSRIECKVYDVGQGACNFIEIYDDSATPELVHTILIDLGSVLVHDAAKDAVAEITATLESMNQPTIDALILTHSDVDHINYIQPLLENFLPQGSTDPGEILDINRVYYGGRYKDYKKGRKKNTLTVLKKYLVGDPDEDMIGVGPDQEGWDETNNVWDPFETIGDVDLYMLAGNTTTAAVDIFQNKKVHKPGTGYLRNMVSIVVILSFAGVDLVFTGDATGLTMARCNQTLAKSGALTSTFMVTLPHHGSEETSFSLLNLSTPAVNAPLLGKRNVQNFVTSVGAKTITASAERHKTYHHPSVDLMTYFWEKVDTVTNYYSDPALAPIKRHFYTAYFPKNHFDADPGNTGVVQDWPPSYNWYTAQTAANVFTTMYFLLDRQNSGKSNHWCAIVPPYAPEVKTAALTVAVPGQVPASPYVGVTWNFTVTSAGVKSVTPVPSSRTKAATGLPVGLLGLDAPAASSGPLAASPVGSRVGHTPGKGLRGLTRLS